LRAPTTSRGSSKRSPGCRRTSRHRAVRLSPVGLACRGLHRPRCDRLDDRDDGACETAHWPGHGTADGPVRPDDLAYLGTTLITVDRSSRVLRSLSISSSGASPACGPPRTGSTTECFSYDCWAYPAPDFTKHGAGSGIVGIHEPRVVHRAIARGCGRVAARYRRRRPGGDSKNANAGPGRPGMAGPPRGPARGRAADGGGWLSGTAKLFHRVGTARRPSRADGRPTGRWRSLAISHRPAEKRRSPRASWADWWLLRLGRRARRPPYSS